MRCHGAQSSAVTRMSSFSCAEKISLRGCGKNRGNPIFAPKGGKTYSAHNSLTLGICMSARSGHAAESAVGYGLPLSKTAHSLRSSAASATPPGAAACLEGA